jgi:hypothetical protein
MSTTTVVATGGFVLVTVGLVGMNVSELAQRRTNNEEFREALQNQETEQMMRLGIATEQDTAEQLAAKAAVKAQRIRDKEVHFSLALPAYSLSLALCVLSSCLARFVCVRACVRVCECCLPTVAPWLGPQISLHRCRLRPRQRRRSLRSASERGRRRNC